MVYLDGALLIDNDNIHTAATRVCQTRALARGAHELYVAGFEAYKDSELEITYAGPDTDSIRAVVGAPAYHPACTPAAAADAGGVRLCAFKSDPTSTVDGDCVPTVGTAHPRYPGPCARAIGTVDNSYSGFAGGYVVPPLGAADGPWVPSRPAPPLRARALRPPGGGRAAAAVGHGGRGSRRGVPQRADRGRSRPPMRARRPC